MKKKLLLIAAVNLALLAQRQQAMGQSKIEGRVTYNNATPLADVAVAIDGTYDGAVTAKDGSFSFETMEVGSHLLMATREGYQDVVQAIDIKDSTSVIKLDLIFTVKAMSLEGVTVRSKALSDDKNKPLSMHSTDILTTATDGNVVSALKTQPGAQQVGESGDLFIRGGTGAESKMFMDGLLVSNFNYSSPANQASRGRFPPGLFKGSYFTSGAYSALYGQALSATLILDTEDLPQKSSADFGISLLSVEGGVQLLSKDKKSLIGASAKYTNLDAVFNLVKPNIDFNNAPKYLDGSLFFKSKFESGGMLKFYGSMGKSEVGLRQRDLDYPAATDEIGLRNNNLYSNLTYTQPIKAWKLYLGSSYSRNADRFTLGLQQEQVPLYDSLSHDNSTMLQFKTVLSRRVLYNGKLQWGGEFIRATDDLESSRRLLGQLTENYSAGFVEVESYFTDRLSARLGLRLENSSLLQRSNLAPRTSLNYTFNNLGLLSFGYGTFYQKPDRRYLMVSPELGFSKSNNYTLTYQKADNYYTFRTEVFYKQYDDLVKTVPGLSNAGSGYAQGLEVLWRDKKTLRRVDYWVAYSYLDTKRDYLNYPFAAQPSFAAQHTLSLVAKRYFPKVRTNLSMSYAFATGRPYYNPNRPTEDFMQDRTINFNNLGLSMCYLPKIGKSFSVIALTFSNILGNKQVFGYSYSTLDPTQRVAITPTNNPFIFLGLFMNFGIDRTNDIINTSL
jgi:vitamin B12 transporter